MQPISRVLLDTWEKEPFKAARGLCVDGWGYMAALGDEEARQRLHKLALTPGEKYGPRAVEALILKVEDQTVWKRLMEIAEDPDLSREERLAALAVGSRWMHEPIPAEAERLACEEVAARRTEKGIYQILMEHATEQSRPTIEAALAQALREAQYATDGSQTRVSEPRRNVRNDSQEASNLCVVGWCVATLRKIHSSQSVPILREVASLPMSSDWSFERINALQGLYEIGDGTFAKPKLEQVADWETAPEARLCAAAALVDIGEPSYRHQLLAGMDSGLEQVRERTYILLKLQNDPSYVAKAAKDFSRDRDQFHPPGYVGFWQLAFQNGDDFPDHLHDYLLAIAREGVTEEARETALRHLLGNDPKLKADDVMPFCREALAGPLTRYPAAGDTQGLTKERVWELQRTWRRTLMVLIAALRFGEPSEREEALHRLEEMTHDAVDSQQDWEIFSALVLARSPDAVPLLKRGLEEDRTPQARLFAANSLLAISLAEPKAGPTP